MDWTKSIAVEMRTGERELEELQEPEDEFNQDDNEQNNHNYCRV